MWHHKDIKFGLVYSLLTHRGFNLYLNTSGSVSTKWLAIKKVDKPGKATIPHHYVHRLGHWDLTTTTCWCGETGDLKSHEISSAEQSVPTIVTEKYQNTLSALSENPWTAIVLMVCPWLICRWDSEHANLLKEKWDFPLSHVEILNENVHSVKLPSINKILPPQASGRIIHKSTLYLLNFSEGT